MGLFDDVAGALGIGGPSFQIRDVANFSPQFTTHVQGLEGDAQNLLEQRRGVLSQAYERALQTTAGTGAANARLIQDQGARDAGNLLGRLGSSGLLNTSVAPNLARGIASDQSRNLLQNNTAVAGLLSGLQVGQGQADAGALGAMAQNLVGRGQRDRGFTLSRAGLQLQRDLGQAQLVESQRDRLGSVITGGAGLALGGF